MKNLTVEGLREVLAEMPPDAEVLISNLCMGRITEDQIVYDEESDIVWFNDKKRNL
jgi:hypothetical protein